MSINALLDSPLEALAFNYISHGLLTAVNNVWAWIAIVTAAVSFWKIKSNSLAPFHKTQDGQAASIEPCRPRSELMHGDVVVSSKITSIPACPVLERQGSSTKVKFRVYYEETEEEIKEDCDDERENEVEKISDEKLGWWCEDRKKMWDMGWYKGQDLTVLDGNVVRLWDGARRRAAAVEVLGGCGDVYGRC